MISARFYLDINEAFKGFIIAGHANTRRHGRDILCAGVSSAVMLSINTITENFGIKAKIKAAGDKVGLKLLYPSDDGSKIIEALFEHLTVLNIGYDKILIKLFHE